MNLLKMLDSAKLELTETLELFGGRQELQVRVEANYNLWFMALEQQDEAALLTCRANNGTMKRIMHLITLKENEVHHRQQNYDLACWRYKGIRSTLKKLTTLPPHGYYDWCKAKGVEE